MKSNSESRVALFLCSIYHQETASHVHAKLGSYRVSVTAILLHSSDKSIIFLVIFSNSPITIILHWQLREVQWIALHPISADHKQGCWQNLSSVLLCSKQLLAFPTLATLLSSLFASDCVKQNISGLHHRTSYLSLPLGVRQATFPLFVMHYPSTYAPSTFQSSNLQWPHL